MHRRWVVVVFAFALWAACGKEEVGSAKGVVTAAPASVDFGQRFVGTESFETVRLTNPGKTQVRMRRGALPQGFDVRPGDLSLGPGAGADVRIVFAPTVPGPAEGEIALRLEGADNDSLAIRVSGEAIQAPLELPDTLDFGLVAVGESRSLPLVVKSLADLDFVGVDLSVEGDDSTGFAVESSAIDLPAGGETSVNVVFTPSAEGQRRARLVVRACTGCPEMRVELSGRGGVARLRLSPASLDFRTVTPGGERTLPFSVQNDGELPASIADVALVEGAEDGFALEDPRALTLGPGESAGFTIHFRAPSQIGSKSGRVHFLDESGEVRLELPLAGASGGIAVVATPSPLDFGPLPLGVTAVRTLRLYNQGELRDVRLEFPEIQGATGVFALRGGDGSRTIDGPSTLPLEVSFGSQAPGEFTAELVFSISEKDPDTSNWLPSGAQPEVRIPISAQAVESAPCSLDLRPAGLRFGAVRLGRSYDRALEIVNAGDADCILWDLALERPTAGQPIFATLGTLPEGSLVLLPGESLKTTIRYTPRTVQSILDEAAFVFRHSSAETPQVRIPISGLATNLNLLIEPSRLSMGRVLLGAVQEEEFTITNLGGSAVGIARIVPAPGPHEAAFGARDDDLPATLPSGSAESFTARFQPTEPGLQETELEIWASGVPEAFLLRARGTGATEPCDAECAAPIAECETTPWGGAGAPTRVWGRGSSPVGNPVTCEWRLLSAPSGSKISPGPNIATDYQGWTCVTDLKPDLAGDYLVELQVVDSNDPSNRTSCQVVLPVTPAGWTQISIQAQWDTAGKIDVHLLNDELGDPYDPTAWWSSADARTPFPSAYDWDEGSAGTTMYDALEGPQYIHVTNAPPSNSYTLAVHNYNNINTPVSITTSVFCGGDPNHWGQLSAIIDTTSHYRKEFFILGTLQYDGTTCSFAQAPDPNTPVWTGIY